MSFFKLSQMVLKEQKGTDEAHSNYFVYKTKIKLKRLIQYQLGLTKTNTLPFYFPHFFPL